MTLKNISCKLENVNVDLPIVEGGSNFKRALLSPFLPKKNDRLLRSSNVVHAIRDVSFTVSHSERIGVVGPNGAGKTTLLRLLAGSYFPTSGNVHINGSITAVLNVGVGMDYDMTGYDNIETCGMLLGMSRKDIRYIRPDIVEFSGLGEFIDMPVRTYSSGMMLRLSFAIATAFNPDILLIDEIIGVGDALFASKARQRIEKLIVDARVLFVASHDEAIIREFCNKVIFLENGSLKFFGEAEEGLQAYANWRNQVQA